jgi:hypothetical protein
MISFDLLFLNYIPLFQYLSTYLCASSILTLRQVNVQCKQLCEQLRCKKIFTQRIQEALKRIGVVDSFNRALLQSHSKISGSFLLQAINNESWFANDIDVYSVRTNHFEPIHNYLWDLTNHNPEKWYTIANRYNLHGWKSKQGFIQEVQAYQINAGTVVQCIDLVLKEIDIDQYIEKMYDLDLLKNTYDGRSVTLHNIQSICTRSSNYKINVADARVVHFHRIKKYLLRGYSICNFRVRSIQTFNAVRLRLYRLKNSNIKKLVYAIHIDDIRQALTLSVSQHWGEIQPRFNANLIPDVRKHCAMVNQPFLQYLPYDFVLEEDFMLLEGLFWIIRSQISLIAHRQEYLIYREMLNYRFGQYHRFVC